MFDVTLIEWVHGIKLNIYHNHKVIHIFFRCLDILPKIHLPFAYLMLHIRRVCCSAMGWITSSASLENYNKQTNSKRCICILWYGWYLNICHWSGFNGMCSIYWVITCVLSLILKIDPNCHQAGSHIAKFMGPTWGPPGADRTQVGPMLALRSLLSGVLCHHSVNTLVFWSFYCFQCVNHDGAEFMLFQKNADIGMVTDALAPASLGHQQAWYWPCGINRGPPQYKDAVLPLIARFMGPTWGPSGADRTQVGPILAPWTLLSGVPFHYPFELNSIQTLASSQWWHWADR